MLNFIVDRNKKGIDKITGEIFKNKNCFKSKFVNRKFL